MNCSDYHGGLTELARGTRLDNLQDAGIRAHLRHCSRCRNEFDAQMRLSAVTAGLSADAAFVTPPGLEAALLAEFDKTYPPRRVGPQRYWFAAAAIAASLLLTWGILRPAPKPSAPVAVKTPSVPAQVLTPVLIAKASPTPRRHRKPTVQPVAEPEQPFVAIPFTAPLAPYERADIVRMDLPVSALIAAGFPLQVSDPGARASADLVVSEDGRARAVRLISISDSNFNRSYK